MSFGQQLLGRFLDILIPSQRLEDFRPGWLHGMELDFFYPDLNVAVEFNGDQHHYHTSFGSPTAQLYRDKLKRRICGEREVRLYAIEAIDLEYTRLAGKLKGCCRGKEYKRRFRAMTGELKALNKEAIAYRAILISRYGSATARRKGSIPRKAAVVALRSRFSGPSESGDSQQAERT